MVIKSAVAEKYHMLLDLVIEADNIPLGAAKSDSVWEIAFKVVKVAKGLLPVNGAGDTDWDGVVGWNLVDVGEAS